MNIKVFYSLLVLATISFSCKKLGPIEPLEEDVLDGPVDGLSNMERAEFLKGDEAFADIFTIDEGLGPVFVANQCAACHIGDGKGTEFVSFMRFGQSDTSGNQFLLQGGPQLQHKAIPGYSPEVLPSGASTTTLIAPAVTGLGYLDAVSDADLLALEDPNDSDGDGISGRVHWNTIPNYVTLRPDAIEVAGRYISRFGKKAAAYDLLAQTAGAYNQDMGITSVFEPIDPFTGLPVEPEVNESIIHQVVFYLKTLKAPIPRSQEDSEVIAGKSLFTQVSCVKCHVDVMQTSYSPIDALSYKEFYPYTDLLLHDMGPDLDDNYTEGYALTSEWRTPALWGLGLSKDSQGGQYLLMHDGRAKSIEEAILLHGGEADQSRQQYAQLSATEKEQLIKFLESL
ncbi:MAG: di-heme oxidoredictase family protein [Crocinitomicaceae bacterium]